jgi:hypothetical protein
MKQETVKPWKVKKSNIPVSSLINVFVVMSNRKKKAPIHRINGQSVDTQNPEKVLRVAQKLKVQLESFKDSNSLSRELYTFSEELIEEFSPCISSNQTSLKPVFP